MFVLQIQSVAGQPNQKNLIFNPRYSDRTYTPDAQSPLGQAGNAAAMREYFR